MGMKVDLDTPAKNTWCPGCGNFGILAAFKLAVRELVNEGKVKKEQIVYSGGIGCHAKIVDYVNLNSFYGIHGRVIPVLQGIKLANPSLRVVGFVGDGDQLDEGISHLIHAAKRNADVAVVLHNNQNFALTTGQRTATSPRGFRGRSTPYGNPEDPLNPVALVLVSGGTFVARAFAGEVRHMASIFKEAIMHRGFAFVEVLQPCVTWYNTFPYFRERVYKIESHDFTDYEAALKLAYEWNDRIPIGIFYKVEKPVYSDEFRWIEGKVLARDRGVPSIREALERWI